MDKIKIGIINVSDRASAGVYKATPAEAVREVLQEYITNECEFIIKVVPDEQILIEATLVELCDAYECCMALTTGGTGPAKRDVTVEATEKVCHKLLPGFGELMRQVSLKYVPTAILSRQTAGVYNHALIVNLPGKPSAIRQCLEAVFPAIPYCIDLIEGPFIETDDKAISIFRPQN